MASVVADGWVKIENDPIFVLSTKQVSELKELIRQQINDYNIVSYLAAVNKESGEAQSKQVKIIIQEKFIEFISGLEMQSFSKEDFNKMLGTLLAPGNWEGLNMQGNALKAQCTKTIRGFLGMEHEQNIGVA